MVFEEMEMKKIPMCRICLVENVRMNVFANTDLQEIYEKLTDIPLVTGDSRPMVACFICYAKLKQCHQFQRKCLETAEVFAQMLNEDYETKPLLHQKHLDHSGYVITPIVHLDIFDDVYCPAESDVVKEEFPTFDGQDDKQQSGSKQKYESMVTVDISPCSPIINTSPNHSTSDAEDDMPLTEFKFELEAEDTIYQEKTRAETKESTPAARKPKIEDTIVTRRKNTELQDTKYIGNTLFMFNPVSESNKDCTHTIPVVNDSITIPPTDNNYKKMYNYCVHCKLSFNSSFELIKHIRTHTDSIYNNIREKSKVLKHFKLKSSLKPYECHICRNSFSGKNDLTKHFRRHTGEKPFKCEICKRSFSENGSLKRHLSSHTGEKPYKCSVCERSFNLSHVLKKHMYEKHTSEKHYMCDICQHVFTKKCNLSKHIRVRHSVEKPYICDICLSSFRDKGCLTRHMRVHTNEKPFNCDQCPLSFNRKDHLNKHRSIHNPEKPFQCDACGRFYKDKGTLKHHIKRHNFEKPYKCDICQRMFRQKISKAHLLKCSGEKSSSNSLKTQKVCIKSFKCDVCERNYATKSILKNHIRTHTNEKPFQCNVCHRSFGYAHHLKEHNLIHTGEKPYKCEICKSGFIKASYLKVHMRIHTGEKPFKCEFCQRSFNRADNLRQHVRTHTGEGPIRRVRKPVTTMQ